MRDFASILLLSASSQVAYASDAPAIDRLPFLYPFNLMLNAIASPSFAILLVVLFSVLGFAVVFRPFYIRLVRLLFRDTNEEIFTKAESLLSSRAEKLASRIEREITNNVNINIDKNLSSISKSVISERIDSQLGDNIISVLGNTISQRASDIYLNEKLVNDISVNLNYGSSRLVSISRDRFLNSSFHSYAALGLSTLGVVAFIYIIIFGRYPAIDSSSDVSMLTINHIAHMAPLYSFSIFCEIISVILFRNSSKLLEQARYFSNEATNLDVTLAGIIISIQKLTVEQQSKAVDALLSSDRNSPISNDKRTYEEISMEIENKNLENLSKLLSIIRPPDTNQNGSQATPGRST